MIAVQRWFIALYLVQRTDCAWIVRVVLIKAWIALCIFELTKLKIAPKVKDALISCILSSFRPCTARFLRGWSWSAFYFELKNETITVSWKETPKYCELSSCSRRPPACNRTAGCSCSEIRSSFRCFYREQSRTRRSRTSTKRRSTIPLGRLLSPLVLVWGEIKNQVLKEIQ